MTRPNAWRFLSKLPLVIILLSGAFLRLYSLGAQSPWWDELLVPMAARHSLTYILNFCSSYEMHPPLFYGIIKTVLLFSSTDSALRLLPALFGILSIYLLYRLVRAFVDEGTALLAAAFLSINMVHIFLSRQIRPYTIQTTLFLLAVWFLARLIKERRWRDLFFLCGVNVLLFWLHYFAYYMVAAQGIVLAFIFFSKPSSGALKRFSAFCIFTAVAAVPLYIWFVLPSTAHLISNMHLPRLIVLKSILNDLWAASFFGFIGRSWADLTYSFVTVRSLVDLMYLVSLAGCVAFVFRKPKFSALCLTLGLVPLAIVLIMAPGYPLRVWHVAWLTPFVSLCAAAAFAWLPARRIIAPLLAAGGAIFIFVCQQSLYYEPIARPNSTDFRATAERLAPLFAPGTLIADASVSGFVNTMSWYFDQSPPNPLTTQSLEPDAASVPLSFVSGFILDDERGTTAPYVQAMMGNLGNVTQARDATIYSFSLQRQPVSPIDSLPASFVFSADPKNFYGRVFRLHNVRTLPTQTLPPQYVTPDGRHVLEGGVIATQNNDDASFEIVLENNAGDTPMHFFTDFHYLNEGIGNRIDLLARFDDEAPVTLVKSAGPDRNRAVRIDFFRNKPFKRLTLHVRMYCKDGTARYYGDNLRTLIFQGLSINIAAAGAAAPSP